MKIKEVCTVVSQEQIAKDIYSLWLQTDKIAGEARPGQFVSLYCADGAKLLPRPISLCEIDAEAGRLRLVYRVAGKGTEEFSKLQAGDTISVLGPLGNGFPLEEAEGKRVFLMGGGIGIPPMLETAKQVNAEKIIIPGYRDELFLMDELQNAGMVYPAVEHPAEGVDCTVGNVLNAVQEKGLEADVIFACGPAPMLRAIKAYAMERQIPCWISMEERMACGVGACLACVCQSKEVDGHSKVHNKRVCKDGPVFLSTEVEL